MAFIIKTNINQITDVLIKDMGIIIPNSGSSVSLLGPEDLNSARLSQNLITLTTDDAYGVNNSTLILNNGSQNIPQDQTYQFISASSGTQGVTGLLGNPGLIGSNGISGDQIVGNIGLLGTPGPEHFGDRGSTGVLGFQIDGSTGILGINGASGITGLQGVTGYGFFISSSIATSGSTTTTTSSSYTSVNSMSITPAAGTYAVWFTGSISNNTNGASVNTAIYAGGSQVASSIRLWTRPSASLSVDSFICTAVVTVDGTQSIQGRWMRSSGTAYMDPRNLLIIKVA